MPSASIHIDYSGHAELQSEVSDDVTKLSLDIPADTIVEEPLEVSLTLKRSSAIHLTIRIKKGSTATIFHHVASLEKTAIESQHHTAIHVEDNAKLHYIFLQDADSTDQLTCHQTVELGNGAECATMNVSLGGKKLEHAFSSEQLGAHAVSTLEWMSYAKGDEKMTLSAKNIFSGSNGNGEITMKGIAEQKAHICAHGLIAIGLGGGGTDTYLTQEVLMLDSTAKVDAIPSLEIKTNDVKASHSATVARITEEDLFYFGARGIKEVDARKLFISGFLGSIVEHVEHEKHRDAILSAIERKMTAYM